MCGRYVGGVALKWHMHNPKPVLCEHRQHRRVQLGTLGMQSRTDSRYVLALAFIKFSWHCFSKFLTGKGGGGATAHISVH